MLSLCKLHICFAVCMYKCMCNMHMFTSVCLYMHVNALCCVSPCIFLHSVHMHACVCTCVHICVHVWCAIRMCAYVHVLQVFAAVTCVYMGWVVYMQLCADMSCYVYSCVGLCVDMNVCTCVQTVCRLPLGVLLFLTEALWGTLCLSLHLAGARWRSSGWCHGDPLGRAAPSPLWVSMARTCFLRTGVRQAWSHPKAQAQYPLTLLDPSALPKG